MFTIKSKQAINWSWASFALVAGENTFTSRKAIPAELWPKLKRFRELEILDFDGDAAAGDDKIELAQLTERHLYDMSKADLAELAKSNGLTVQPAAGMDEPSKKLLLDALVALLPKPEPAVQATEATTPAGNTPAEAGASTGKNSRRGGGSPASATEG